MIILYIILFLLLGIVYVSHNWFHPRNTIYGTVIISDLKKYRKPWLNLIGLTCSKWLGSTSNIKVDLPIWAGLVWYECMNRISSWCKHQNLLCQQSFEKWFMWSNFLNVNILKTVQRYVVVYWRNTLFQGCFWNSSPYNLALSPFSGYT